MFERELNDLLNGLMPPAKTPFGRQAQSGQFAGCDLPGELRFEQLADGRLAGAAGACDQKKHSSADANEGYGGWKGPRKEEGF